MKNKSTGLLWWLLLPPLLALGMVAATPWLVDRRRGVSVGVQGGHRSMDDHNGYQ